jgi:fatty-acyl-CoA synthase
MLAAVYGVPDADAGDQVMAALVLRSGASFDGLRFARWIDEQAVISPKWRPRYIRVCTSLPVTPTNKVLTRVLMHEKFRADRLGGDDLFVRPRAAVRYVRFTAEDESSLRTAFDAAGRSRFWDF